MSRRYQLLSGVLAATVSLSLTGCGSNETASSAPATSTAPAASETEASTTSNVESLSTEEAGNSFSYIGSEEENPVDETIQGTVTAIEGDTVSLTVGGNTMAAPPDMPQGENSGDNGGNGDNGGTPPELPSDSQNTENAETTEAADNADPSAVPAEPDDTQTADETGGTAENPGTPPDQSGDSSQSEAKTATLVLADETVLAKNDEDGTQIEASLSDISVGDILSITFDENGDITAVVIEAGGTMAAPGGMGGPGGGSSAPTSYDAVNEYSEDTTVSGESISSTGTDENAVLVDGDAEVTLSNVTVNRTSQDSTGGDSSSFYGVGAAVLGTAGSTYVKDSTITTDASGGAGLFAYSGGTVYASDSTITTTQDTSGGIHSEGGGTL